MIVTSRLLQYNQLAHSLLVTLPLVNTSRTLLSCAMATATAQNNYHPPHGTSQPLYRIEPKPGQESVWDYPRPPRQEKVPQTVRIVFNGQEIVNTNNAVRVLETSSPPTFYIPREDVKSNGTVTQAQGKSSHCPWKGDATYWDITVGDKTSEAAAWSYEDPIPAFQNIRSYLSFYPGRVDACFVGDEQVKPQAGSYYGGWVTSNIVGPFKGEPGTLGW